METTLHYPAHDYTHLYKPPPHNPILYNPKCNRRTPRLRPSRSSNIQISTTAKNHPKPPLRNPAAHDPIPIHIARHNRIPLTRSLRVRLHIQHANLRAGLGGIQLNIRVGNQPRLSAGRKPKVRRHCRANIVDVVLQIAIDDGEVSPLTGAVVQDELALLGWLDDVCYCCCGLEVGADGCGGGYGCGLDEHGGDDDVDH